MKIRKPNRIIIHTLDPLDQGELTFADLPYDQRKAAEGFYTQKAIPQFIKAVKAGCSHILQGREPVVTINLIYV